MEKISKKYVDSLDGRLSSQSLLIPRRSRTLVWGFEPHRFFPSNLALLIGSSRRGCHAARHRPPAGFASPACWELCVALATIGSPSLHAPRQSKWLLSPCPRLPSAPSPPRLRRPPVRARRRPRSPRAGPRGASEKSLDGARRTVAHAARVAPGPVARRSRRGRVARTRVPRSPRDPGSLARSSPRVAIASRRLGLRRAARARHPSEIAGALAIHSLRPRSRASDLVPPLTSPRPPAIPPSRPRSSTRAVQAAKPSLSARVCVPARPPPSRPPLPLLIVPRPSTASTQQRRVQIFTRRGRDWRLRLKRASAFFIRLADPPSPSALFARTGP